MKRLLCQLRNSKARCFPLLCACAYKKARITFSLLNLNILVPVHNGEKDQKTEKN